MVHGSRKKIIRGDFRDFLEMNEAPLSGNGLAVHGASVPPLFPYFPQFQQIFTGGDKGIFFLGEMETYQMRNRLRI